MKAAPEPAASGSPEPLRSCRTQAQTTHGTSACLRPTAAEPAHNDGRVVRKSEHVTGDRCWWARTLRPRHTCRYGAPVGSHLPTFCAHVLCTEVKRRSADMAPTRPWSLRAHVA